MNRQTPGRRPAGARFLPAALSIALAAVLWIEPAIGPGTSTSSFAPGHAQARETANEDDGSVGRKSRALSFASAARIEREAGTQYRDLMREASRKGALAPASDPQLQRLRGVAARLIAQATRYNARAADWKWEVNLLGSSQINAFCMPGGKIAFFSGILTKLRLTDDELAIVMGHEIAHALREHGRERAGKELWARIGTAVAAIGGALIGLGDLGGQVASGTAQVALLRNSRSDETEADLVGLDLAARAGFDPRAGLVVWQKMEAAGKGRGEPCLLYTSPSPRD